MRVNRNLAVAVARNRENKIVGGKGSKKTGLGKSRYGQPSIRARLFALIPLPTARGNTAGEKLAQRTAQTAFSLFSFFFPFFFSVLWPSRRPRALATSSREGARAGRALKVRRAQREAFFFSSTCFLVEREAKILAKLVHNLEAW